MVEGIGGTPASGSPRLVEISDRGNRVPTCAAVGRADCGNRPVDRPGARRILPRQRWHQGPKPGKQARDGGPDVRNLAPSTLAALSALGGCAGPQPAQPLSGMNRRRTTIAKRRPLTSALTRRPSSAGFAGLWPGGAGRQKGTASRTCATTGACRRRPTSTGFKAVAYSLVEVYYAIPRQHPAGLRAARHRHGHGPAL